MIIRKKRKTRLIDDGDGVDHSESYEKSAPGYHSQGYSYSSSVSKSFSEDDEEVNPYLKAGGLVAAGGAVGYGGRKLAGVAMRASADRKYKSDMEVLEKHMKNRTEASENRNIFKKLIGWGDTSTDIARDRVKGQKRLEQEMADRKLKAGKGAKRWGLLGAGLVAGGIVGGNLMNRKRRPQMMSREEALEDPVAPPATHP